MIDLRGKSSDFSFEQREWEYRGKKFTASKSYGKFTLASPGSSVSNRLHVDQEIYRLLGEKDLLGKLAYWYEKTYENLSVSIESMESQQYDNDEDLTTRNNEYLVQWLDAALQTVEETGDDLDLLMGFNMKPVSHAFHDFTVVDFDDWSAMWERHKNKVATPVRYRKMSGNDARVMVEEFLRHEYELHGHEKYTSFMLTNSHCKLVDYAKEGFDARMAVYQEIIRRFPQESKAEAKDAWLWSKSPARTSRILLSAVTSHNSVKLAGELLAADNTTRSVVAKMGSHVLKRDKYLKEISVLLDSFEEVQNNRDQGTAIKIVHSSQGKIRIFSDAFLVGLLGGDMQDTVGNSEEAQEIVERIAGFEKTQHGLLHRSQYVPHMKFAPSPADINYVVALLVNRFGAYEGVSRLLDAVESDFSRPVNTVPSVAQWEKYTKNGEDFKDVPFEIGIELASFRRG